MIFFIEKAVPAVEIAPFGAERPRASEITASSKELRQRRDDTVNEDG
ncbi:hypothetical protein [Mesorhizobium abyssinicae]